jgi:microcystin-dependent protein
MAEPFVAEIRITGFNFAPTGWATCNGQIMPLAMNTALFSLLGTMYGGDGKSTFALPDLQGRAPMHWGQGPGLSDHWVGDMPGEPSVTLISSEMPAHSHTVRATTSAGKKASPAGATWGEATAAPGQQLYHNSSGATEALPWTAFATAGSTLPHNNMQPYLTLNFIIALQGVYPARW